MITGYLIGDKDVVARLRGLPAHARTNLRSELEGLALRMTVMVKAEKLSGQVLKVQTGRLRRSITWKVSDTGTGIYATVGTNVEYAPRHEYGFSGAEQVKAHLRKLASGRRVPVRAHARTVNAPERSFLRSSLQEMRGEIREGMRRVMRDAINGERRP